MLFRRGPPCGGHERTVIISYPQFYYLDQKFFRKDGAEASEDVISSRYIITNFENGDVLSGLFIVNTEPFHG